MKEYLEGSRGHGKKCSMAVKEKASAKEREREKQKRQIDIGYQERSTYEFAHKQQH